MKHTISYHKTLNDKVSLDYREVVMKTLDASEIDTIQPFKRVY